jgi:transaldolase
MMIKVPGMPLGIPAFQQAISKGININVTLVFSLENYRQACCPGCSVRGAVNTCRMASLDAGKAQRP